MCIFYYTLLFDLSTVILLVVIGPIVRELMVEAYDLGFINGEYAFFSFYPFNNRFIFGDDNWKQVKYKKMKSVFPNLSVHSVRNLDCRDCLLPLPIMLGQGKRQ